MLEEVQARLADVLRYSTESQTFLEGKSYLAYSNDVRLRRAVERSLSIACEAVWQAVKMNPSLALHLSDTTRIVGLRHRLVHDYRAVSNGVIYDVVQEKLPALQEEVRNLLLGMETDNGDLDESN